MEIITGRLTAHAQVKTLKDKRQLVVFNMAVNHYYAVKGEKKNDTNFYNCAYWLSTKVATFLTKGSIVSLCGHTGLNAYKDMSGDFHAYLTFHVNHIDILVKGKAKDIALVEDKPATENKDDLPF